MRPLQGFSAVPYYNRSLHEILVVMDRHVLYALSLCIVMLKAPTTSSWLAGYAAGNLSSGQERGLPARAALRKLSDEGRISSIPSTLRCVVEVHTAHELSPTLQLGLRA